MKKFWEDLGIYTLTILITFVSFGCAYIAFKTDSMKEFFGESFLFSAGIASIIFINKKR